MKKRTLGRLLAMLVALAMLLGTTAWSEELEILQAEEEVDILSEDADTSSEDAEEMPPEITELAELELPAPDEAGKQAEGADAEAVEPSMAQPNGAVANDTCEHATLWLDPDDLDISVESYTPAGKYWHTTTMSMSGTAYMRCEDCGEIVESSTISPAIQMKTKSLCHFENGECTLCGQKGTRCEHEYYSSEYALPGSADYANDWDCLYFNENWHAERVLTGVDDGEMSVSLYVCDDCGAMATCGYDSENDEHEEPYWWDSDEIGLVGTECEAVWFLESHTYVDGVCIECGHVKESASVKLSASSMTLGVKESRTLSAVVTPASSAGELRYKSSNKKIATVNAKTGKVTGKKKGKATISATLNGKAMAKCKVTVKKAPGKVTMSKKKATVKAGNTLKLKAKLPSGTASAIKWSSNKKSVATVDQKGVVTGKKKGTATITAKAFNGKKATCKVTVKQIKRIELIDYMGKDAETTANKLGLYYHREGYQDDIESIEIFDDFGKGIEQMAIFSNNKKHCIEGIYPGMTFAAAKITLKAKGYTVSNEQYDGSKKYTFINQYRIECFGSTSGDKIESIYIQKTVEGTTQNYVELSGYYKKDGEQSAQAIGGLTYEETDGEDGIDEIYYNDALLLFVGGSIIHGIRICGKSNYMLLGIKYGMSRQSIRDKMNGYTIEWPDMDDEYGVSYIIQGSRDNVVIRLYVSYDEYGNANEIEYGLMS